MRIHLLVGALLGCGWVTGSSAFGDDAVPQQLIIRLGSDDSLAQINAQFGTSEAGSIPLQNLFLLELPPDVNAEVLIQALQNGGFVEWAELNYFLRCPEGQTQSFFFNIEPQEYQTQYAWELMELPAAHGIARGLGVTVAVLDTGVDASHAALSGRIALSGFNFVDMNTDTSDVASGTDSDGDGVPDELVGHGTFMAGIVAAVAPQASILPVKVLTSDGVADAFRVAQGIFYAIENGAAVLNLSLGAEHPSLVIAQALAEARLAGAVVVAAAGNENALEPVLYPAGDVNAVGVAATDANDLKSRFSNFGPHIAVSAPGSSIVSTMPGEQFARGDGTSLSTAVVSGVAALLKSSQPNASPDAVILAIATSAADLDLSNPDHAGMLGGGRVNSLSALQALDVDPPVVGDLSGDGVVSVTDLLMLIAAWGPCSSALCPADLNQSGAVEVGDLLLMLQHWG